MEGTPDSRTQAWTQLHKITLEGTHTAKTSINYSCHLDLGDFFLSPRSGLRATFALVGGTTFQINGLALCHSNLPLEDTDVTSRP